LAKAAGSLTTFLEAIDPGGSLDRIRLGGIFQIRHPPFVHFLGNPAFMPDMTVSAHPPARHPDRAGT
jgi:hypothetical protein